MKIPLVWLKDYIQTTKTPKELAESFTALGLMLDKPIQYNVLDLEHRMDRSDWLAILGCARDLAAFENTELKYPIVPNKSGLRPEKGQLVDIKVESEDLVNRFTTKVIKGIKVGESPEWLRERLEAYGIPCINNIVDITNFVMVEYGQPLHAQDLSKFQKKEIVLRRAKKGEKIVTLLGGTVNLDPEVLILAQNDKPIVLGGIVGGKETSVTEKTTDIVVDAGNYNQTNIRKTSRRLKIQNESVLRNDKFLHPKLTEIAINRVASLILELAGGELFENVDWYPKVLGQKRIILTHARLNLISGTIFDWEKAKSILTKLEYSLIKDGAESTEFEVPYFRTDVEVEDDLISDVLRINDYANIESQAINLASPKELTPAIYKFEEQIRDALTMLGAHEHITSPLVNSKEVDEANRVILENSLNAEQDSLRTSISETLQKVALQYSKHGITDFVLFEIGKVYTQEGDEFIETRLVEIMCTETKKLKQILAGFLMSLGIDNIKYGEQGTLEKDGKKLGVIHPDHIDLFTQALFECQRVGLRVVNEFSHYSTEDLSLTVGGKVNFGPVLFEIRNFDPSILNAEVVDSYQKSILVRITFESANNTEIKTALIKMLKKDFDIEVRH